MDRTNYFFLERGGKSFAVHFILDEEKQKSKRQLQNIYNTRPLEQPLSTTVPTNLLTQERLTQGDL